MTDRFVYPGKDLEAMSFAINYHRWILDEFRPYLGRDVIEVGAGTGSFSELLLEENIDTLTMVEPSEMFESLQANISRIETVVQRSFVNSAFVGLGNQIAPDTIIYVNVLEHIEDDLAELRLVHEALTEGGKCLIFVPALSALYGRFDRKVGHYRRYSKRELEEKCLTAGFRLTKSRYFDIAGIAPWYLKYKLLNSDSLEPRAVELYDRLVVPVMSRVETRLPIPIGKNLLVVAEKVGENGL